MEIVQGGYKTEQSAEERKFIDRAYPGGPEKWRELALKLEDSCRSALRVSPMPPGEETVRVNWHDVTVVLTSEELQACGGIENVAESIQNSLTELLRQEGETYTPYVEPIEGNNTLAVRLAKFCLYSTQDIFQYFDQELSSTTELQCATNSGYFSVERVRHESGGASLITATYQGSELGAISRIDFGCDGIKRILVNGQEDNKVEDNYYFKNATAIVRRLREGIIHGIDVSFFLSGYGQSQR